jgi:hypothetical protein
MLGKYYKIEEKTSWKLKKVTDLKESDLHIALDKVERSDGRVSETTAENTSGSTGGVEGRRIHLDLPARLVRCRNDDVSRRRREAVV